MVKPDVILSKIPLLNIFSSKKMIRNRTINKLGIQPYRIRLAEKRYSKRPRYLTDQIKPYIETLQRDGIVVIPDFLPQDQFAELEKECLQALEKETLSVKRQDGPNFYTNINSSKLGAYTKIQKIFENPQIENLFKAAERRNLKLNSITRLLTCLVQGEDNDTVDPETNLHEDTFFNTHKAWLYITDVGREQAPFVYVKGSQRNDITDRLKKAYEYSLNVNNTHSRRISDAELKELGLEESVYMAKKNTFVLANTLGFHRRLRGVAHNKRIALAFSARHNPFL